MKILVTGASGQLGQEFQNNVSKSKDDFYFTDEKELDITNKNRILNYVSDNQIQLIINCAAYTDVNGSETNKKQAIKVNLDAVKNIVEVSTSTFTVPLVSVSWLEDPPPLDTALST